ncbi:hypothetical protein NIES22_50840 [Calothrix brevissima NIES-22]|nr:hypothetical protein NIES22_50840 [Calothrix brevissima NIES-22]
MISYNIKAKGSLFSNKNLFKEILRESLNETADWAKSRVKSRTPVITGRLKAGWNTTTNQQSFNLNNPVYYAPYVERRRGMLYKTVPEAESKLISNTERLIKDKTQ